MESRVGGFSPATYNPSPSTRTVTSQNRDWTIMSLQDVNHDNICCMWQTSYWRQRLFSLMTWQGSSDHRPTMNGDNSHSKIVPQKEKVHISTRLAAKTHCAKIELYVWVSVCIDVRCIRGVVTVAFSGPKCISNITLFCRPYSRTLQTRHKYRVYNISYVKICIQIEKGFSKNVYGRVIYLHVCQVV